jgi:cell filamentation protein, protein adenylyltransferase
MNPPYEVSSTILNLITSISEKIGAINAAHLHRPSPELRKRNRVKTIQASLEIEGNTLTEDQITSIIENKRVIGPKKDIKEVVNAIEVYRKLSKFDPFSFKSFLKAHEILMEGLIEDNGVLRKKSVGIVKGNEVAHLAPPADNLAFLMKDLFEYIEKSKDPILIVSCVVHYEIEFIHPFIDGNGRMGRLWQTLILSKEYPIFEHLPFETIIKEQQQEYYDVLAKCDKEGKSTHFIEFMLDAINKSLDNLLDYQIKKQTPKDRLEYFLTIDKTVKFTRKDYMKFFKEISSATASRDLKYGIVNDILKKEGDKRNTIYQIGEKLNLTQ